MAPIDDVTAAINWIFEADRGHLSKACQGYRKQEEGAKAAARPKDPKKAEDKGGAGQEAAPKKAAKARSSQKPTTKPAETRQPGSEPARPAQERHRRRIRQTWKRC